MKDHIKKDAYSDGYSYYFPENPTDEPILKHEEIRGVWIPSEIFFNPNLTAAEKLLLGEIFNLSPNDGSGCFASNKYLGRIMGLSASRIANVISDLRGRGYVETLGFDGYMRRLVCTLKSD